MLSGGRPFGAESAIACRVHHRSTGAGSYHRIRTASSEMDDAGTKGNQSMNCNMQGCLGHYEQRSVIQTVRHQGRVVVIDHVPADVCPACGDVLFHPDTVRALERLLNTVRQPDASVPLYEYA